MTNEPKDQVNQPERDLERLNISTAQLKKDLRDAELQNDIIMLGMKQMIRKYKKLARQSSCLITKLTCSIVIEDLRTSVKVANTHINQILK